MPAPPNAAATGADGAEGNGGEVLPGIAAAAPGPANAASAAISATITAPRFLTVLFAISHSLSLSALAHEPQSLSGLCGGPAGRASPVRGRGLRNSLVRVISGAGTATPQRGSDMSRARKRGDRHQRRENDLPWWKPRQQAASCRGFLSHQGRSRSRSDASRRFGSSNSLSKRARVPGFMSA